MEISQDCNPVTLIILLPYIDYISTARLLALSSFFFQTKDNQRGTLSQLKIEHPIIFSIDWKSKNHYQFY